VSPARHSLSVLTICFSRFLVAGCAAMALNHGAAASPAVEIQFARSVVQFVDGRILPNGIRNRFDCNERIHGIFRITNLAMGKHALQTRWRSPTGKVERINSRRIRVRRPDRVVYLSSTIEFRGDSGVFALIDPSAGFEPYLGKWTVEAVVQGKVIGNAQFEVLC